MGLPPVAGTVLPILKKDRQRVAGKKGFLSLSLRG